MTLRRLVLRSLVPGLLVLTVACASVGSRPPAPPAASIQKLALAADGSLALELRIQNYAKKGVHFATLDAQLTLAGVDAGELHAPIGFDIPGRNSEVLSTKLVPTPGIQAALRKALGAAVTPGEAPYRLKGTIVTDKPSAHYPLDYSSALSPVPGVPNEYR